MQIDYLSIIYKIKHAIVIIEKILGASSLFLLLTLSMFQLIARNFFDIAFAELDVIARHLILFIIFMGAALVSEHNKHIKIDILTPFLSEKQQRQLVRPLLFISSLVSGIFCWYSIIFWLDEWQYAPINEQWSVYLILILPIGFFILALHLLLLSITGIKTTQKNCLEMSKKTITQKEFEDNHTKEKLSCSDFN